MIKSYLTVMRKKQCISQLSGGLDCLYNLHFLYAVPEKVTYAAPTVMTLPDISRHI